jgi:hypothetical protein
VAIATLTQKLVSLFEAEFQIHFKSEHLFSSDDNFLYVFRVTETNRNAFQQTEEAIFQFECLECNNDKNDLQFIISMNFSIVILVCTCCRCYQVLHCYSK